MFLIRADGNSVIGMGHVMRCLSIADAVKTHGVEVIFVTACEECIPMIQQRGFQTRLLTTDYRDMLSELPQLKQLLSAEKEMIKKHVILVDSYQVSKAYYRELRKLGCVACLEDMGQPYPVDLLINYNIYGEKLAPQYAAGNENKPDKTLLGVSYMPLRQEFLTDMEYTLKEEVTDVMITTGGSDPLFAAKAFTDAFLADKTLQRAKIRYHIISGPFNSHAQELKQMYTNHIDVTIYENVKSMKEIMRQCDVVLTAAGSTIYEVSALGVPMLVFYFAENQRQGAEEIGKRTSVINCGDFSKQSNEVVDKAVKTLQRCVLDKSYRELLMQDERKLVDGKGAYRIAEAINECGKEMYLREKGKS